MTLRGVIFDLGGTLMNFHPPGGGWREMEARGAAGWYAYLAARGYALPDEAAVIEAIWRQVSSAWRDLGEGRLVDMAEMALVRQLAKAAAALGIALTPEDALEAERAYVARIQEVVQPIPGGRETLRALQQRGLRLALISNTMWPGEFHRADLARFDLLAPFEALFFSADENAWKPAPEIFQRAVRALDVAPEEAVYIGDSRMLDVWGAQQAGLRGVWVENDDPYLPQGMDIIPDATIRRLTDLLPVVDAWRNHLEQVQK